MTTNQLSPTTQAVLDAFTTSPIVLPTKTTDLSLLLLEPLAAALRAAADQVVPNGPKPSANSDYHLNNWTKSLDQYYQRQQTRDELLAIADELEGKGNV